MPSPDYAAQQLTRLDLDLLLFAADVGDHVVQDVHGGHARIARARDRLHAHHVHRGQAEGVVQRLQRTDQVGGGAVRVGDDEPTFHPRRACWTGMSAVWSGLTSGISSGTSGSIRCAAAFEQTAKPAAASSSSTAPGVAAGQRREEQPHVGRDRGRLGGHDHPIGQRRRHPAAQQPLARVRVALAHRAIRCGQRADLEVGVIGDELGEALSHRARRAQDTDFDLGVICHFDPRVAFCWFSC